ncbi:phosphate signaling complex protein PhoU [Pseudonocardia spinosispora]|uniref:phosphate signaling complex protein PhoU n=1 Tax=Pseudonocardia spinosispora TaxID=103441 RepID=UPI00041BA12F|nr:phosphate signaling complex protein PhoU [Pseudonocardia spinosispora]
MRDRYHEQLGLLDLQLDRMCQLVAEAMRLASRATLNLDLQLAEEVITGDARIDRARTSHVDAAHRLLALQAPVATDLRAVLAGIHIADSLERMGDLAVHVAEAARRRHPDPAVPMPLRPRFVEMGRVAVDAAVTVREVVRTKDLSLIPALCRADDEIDELHRTLFAVLGHASWDRAATMAVDVSLLSRFHERFADHAVSVARHVAYAVTGEHRTTGDTAFAALAVGE